MSLDWGSSEIWAEDGASAHVLPTEGHWGRQALAKGPGVDSWFWVLATQLHKDPSQARLGIVELVTQPVSVSLSVMWGEDGIYPSGPPEVL